MNGLISLVFLLSNQSAMGTITPATSPYTARITLPNAEVRSGPGSDSKLYGTNNLKAGDLITVVQERNDGWLAIRPPEGSFSWVQSKYLQRIVANQPNYLVQINDGNKVPVYIGSALLNTKPTIESAKLIRGTQVKALGSPQVDNQETWIPIVPPENELRYIRCEAIGKQSAQVKPALPVNQVPVTSVSSAGVGSTNSVVNANASVPNCDPNLRWNQAVAAETAGQTTEAIRQYTQISQDFACSQPMFSNQCYSRAAWLRDCTARGKTNTVMACAPGQPKLINKPLVQAISNAPINGSINNPVNNNMQEAPSPSPNTVPQNNYQAVVSGPTPAPVKPINSGSGTGVGPGYLRKGGRPQSQDPSYYIESQQGRPLIYLIPAPGQNLDLFLNQRVEVSGPSSYRSDMRAYVMTVYQIQPR